MEDIFKSIAVTDQFEYREQQVHMAKMISRSLTEKKPCLIEAATGIGKSLGLLVPAIRDLIASLDNDFVFYDEAAMALASECVEVVSGGRGMGN